MIPAVVVRESGAEGAIFTFRHDESPSFTFLLAARISITRASCPKMQLVIVTSYVA